MSPVFRQTLKLLNKTLKIAKIELVRNDWKELGVAALDNIDSLYKYVALFFYPLDFTFVCPSEIIAFDHLKNEIII